MGTVRGGEKMEVIEWGTEDLREMVALNCCWPPGTLNNQVPEEV